ncbi:hypothetical protein [Planococcus sp. ISL-109]|nr:hypothetical protein [Planococcus sp. ISL-109]
MSNMEMFGAGSWMGIVWVLLFVASFYFTLPVVYQLYFINEMMR